MKKTIFALVSAALVLLLTYNAYADPEKQKELEKRVDHLQIEVDKLRQSIEAPRNPGEADYLSEVMERVKENWFFPEDLEVKSDEFLKVAVTIKRDGTVTDQRVVESSGNDQFNAHALESLTKSIPLPSIPAEMNREFIEVELSFKPPKN